MRESVRASWIEMNTPLEGCLNYAYADVLGLITTGMGNLIDPVSTAMGLPWQLDGRAARGDEIAAQWWRVKNDPLSASRGHLYAKNLTTMRLTPQGVEMVVFRKLDANDAVLESRFPDMADWPACAQMATHSLSWACGPSFHFPKLASALLARDFDAAAIACTINEWNGSVHNTGVIPRNVANRLLYRNAQRVDSFRLDPSLLAWADDLSVADAPTIPALDDPDSEPNTTASCPTVYPSPLPYLGEDPDEKT